MDVTDIFSTETTTVPIRIRLFAIAYLSLSLTSERFSAKWDRGLNTRCSLNHFWEEVQGSFNSMY